MYLVYTFEFIPVLDKFIFPNYSNILHFPKKLLLSIYILVHDLYGGGIYDCFVI